MPDEKIDLLKLSEMALASAAEVAKKEPDTDERWKQGDSVSGGGQGDTFYVTDLKDEFKGQYVIKRLRGSKAQARDRFMEEIATTQKIDHPGIVKVVHFGLSKKSGKPFYVMPYLPGGDLADFMKKNHGNKLKLLECFRRLCIAVKAAHDKQIIHRDIKPENVMFDEHGDPVLVDFGIAFDMLDEKGRLTKVNEVVGTRGLTAPELESGRLKPEDLNPGVDIYNLGKVLWMMLASKDEPLIFAREEWDEPSNDLINVRQDIDMKYINDLIISKTVVKDPNKRLREVSAIITRLERIIDLIQRGFEPIRKDGMTCKFCGEGNYRPIVDSTTFTKEMFDSGSQNITPLAKFGFTPTLGANWRILACDGCGHSQIFRLDHRYAPGDPPW